MKKCDICGKEIGKGKSSYVNPKTGQVVCEPCFIKLAQKADKVTFHDPERVN